LRLFLRHVTGANTPREAGGLLLAIAGGFIVSTLLLAGVLQLTGVDLRAPPEWATVASLILVAGLFVSSVWFVIGAVASFARGGREPGGARRFGRDELLIAIAIAGSAAVWSGRATYMIADGEPVFEAFGLTAARGLWAVRVDEDTLRVAGDITPGLARRIAQELDEDSKIAALAIDSPGGRLDAARQIAALVKAYDLDVEVRALCASACLTVLVAGRRRIASPRAAIGCHQPADMITGESVGEFGAFPTIFPARGGAATYREVLAVCNQTPPEDLYFIPLEDLQRIGAVTHVGRRE
jgi:hypothetical protein